MKLDGWIIFGSFFVFSKEYGWLKPNFIIFGINWKIFAEFNIDIFSAGTSYNFFKIFVDSKNLSENEINELNKIKNSNNKEIESLIVEYNVNVIGIKNLVRNYVNFFSIELGKIYIYKNWYE